MKRVTFALALLSVFTILTGCSRPARYQLVAMNAPAAGDVPWRPPPALRLNTETGDMVVIQPEPVGYGKTLSDEKVYYSFRVASPGETATLREMVQNQVK